MSLTCHFSWGHTPTSTTTIGLKTSNCSKINWKGQNKHTKGGRFQSFDKLNRASGVASGSGSHRHGNAALGQKRKLPRHEEKKKDYWIQANQNLSPTEFQQRFKTCSCINCGEQYHIFEACTKPKPS